MIVKEPLVLDGRFLAKQREKNLCVRVKQITKAQTQPILATILVGSDPASATYVNMKGRACNRVGFESKKIVLPETIKTKELLLIIRQLNEDDRIHGILLQHPVPPQIDERICFNEIDIRKDVDGVSSCSFGKLAMGESAYGSATPQGIMSLLQYYQINIIGKHAVVIGRSAILGKPMAMMLLNKNATVSICHSHTKNLSKLVQQADILVAAVGKPKFVKGEWIKTGAVVIDAGYHPEQKCGDVDLQSCQDRMLAFTPVPGGVGPMTISTLIEQTVLATEKYCNR